MSSYPLKQSEKPRRQIYVLIILETANVPTSQEELGMAKIKLVSTNGLPLQDLAGTRVSDMILIYTSLVKSILEYSCVMFSNLLLYLSDATKNVQKHCPPQIIFPTLSYTEALTVSN
ncbi:unnamed protein product [Pocillopora meandrina]|uniref:Uncharacterized protein n=1 Tax=Pocillopora meandrina TaxID=46732 RepID=A0AAU9W1A9_9CNID|nr:unnamed protein product [Pocillopora meandrina]